MTDVPPDRVRRTTQLLGQLDDDPDTVTFYSDEVRFVWDFGEDDDE